MPSWPRFGPWLAAAALSFVTQGAAQSVPASNLDLSGLGQVALTGDFDAVSTYSYAGQTEQFSSNGTQSVVTQLSSGFFDKLATTDGTIQTMCPFYLKDGTLAGVIVAGNFTSIGGVATRSIAAIDPNTFEVTPQVGVQGSISALYCDQDTETVYVGGMFMTSTSTNAVTWISAGTWSNLPFAGFDGPVTSITKAPSGNIVFGGSFTGLGNATGMSTTSTNTSLTDGQVINVGTANITSIANTTSGNNIICPPSGSSSIPWLLQDNTPGYWQATFGYGFTPSRLRLWNTNLGGRGTKTWRFTTQPNGGIMNFTYTDPATGQTTHCDATCPLSNDPSVQYQDFYFVNQVGMNDVRIDVSAWYGAGGGLAGVELSSSQIFAYAIDAFNEPACSGSGTVSSVTTTGSWYEVPSRGATLNYLTVVTGPTTVGSTEIVFQPDVKQSGNYTVLVYTPGCIQDSSCSARAIVNVTGSLTNSGQSFASMLYQTNDYDKYDPVYTGRIDASSSSFSPSITIRPSGLQTDQLIVASQVQLVMLNSTGGLNGLFEYDPSQATINPNFSASAINNVGNTLKSNAQIIVLQTVNDTIYAGGTFTDDVFENIMAFANNKATALSGSGLNASVLDMWADTDYLYVGGNFTGTSEGSTSGLNNIAAYHYSDQTWQALGAGVDGAVEHVVAFPVNLTGSSIEITVAISGNFTHLLPFNGGPSTAVAGFAVWIPSQKNWLENLNMTQQSLKGQLSTFTNLGNHTWLGAGTLTSLGNAISGVVELQPASNGNVRLQSNPFQISSSASSSSSSLSKRALAEGQNISGVVTGTFYNNGGRNVSVFGGHFTANGNIENLAFVNGSNNNAVTGLPQGIDTNSTFLSLAVQNDLLIAGGMVTGEVNNVEIDGLVLYDLRAASFRSVQPAALVGRNVIVNAIAPQPSTSGVYVGGVFDETSQQLSCRSVCMYDTSANQWSTVGGQLGGNVSALYWQTTGQLLAAGNLSVSGNQTGLATYDTKQQTWTAKNSTGIPGPVSVFAPGSDDDSRMWVAGTANNGSAYLVQVYNNEFLPVAGAFQTGTTVQSLQVMQVNQNHGSSQFFDGNNYVLLVLGQLNLTSFGTASAAIFNGTMFEPFILSTTADGNPGSISSLVSSQTVALPTHGHRHSNGIAVLVALCAALGTIFLLILIGIIFNRVQRWRSGYSTVPSVPYADKHSNINRVPPESLFGTLGQKRNGAPAV